MIRRFHDLGPNLRRHGALAFVAALILPAAACSDPAPATPQVIFTSEIDPGPNPATSCPEGGTWFNIGDFGNPGTGAKPVAVKNGGTDPNGGQVSLQCSVTLAKDGFDVRGTARLTGGNGGSFTVRGTFKADGDQTGISATFAKVGRTDAYIAEGCTVRYTSPNQGVAAGRVWGEITCPTASASSVNRTCQAVAEFRFENCDQ